MKIAPLRVTKRGQVTQVQIRKSYTLAQKLTMMDRARAYGIRVTATTNGIHRSQLQKWFKKEEEIRFTALRRGTNQYHRTRIDGNGRGSTISLETEIRFMEWFNERRDEQNSSDKGPMKVNINMCIAAIRRIDNTLCRVPRILLRRRLWRMFHRRAITERAITHYAQKVRSCTDMINGFQEYLQEMMKTLKIGVANVCNFDQTNVFFSPDCKRTLATRGSKEVSALQKESNQRCTVMLGCSAGGEKFDPYIIWKGKNSPSGQIFRRNQQIDYNRNQGIPYWEGFYTSNYYAVQENAWMESSLVVDWIQKVYQPWAEEKNEPTIIILDEFAGHMTHEVRTAISAVGGHLVLIPGGYTWKLQPMDIGLDKPFKNKIRDIYDDWGYTNAYDAKPQREDVSLWIKYAWDQITFPNMVRSWEKIGINQDEVQEFDYDEELDLAGTDDGDGIDCLEFNQETITEISEEEEEADHMYTDINENDDVHIE
jgi:DDE superfamily endonuclease